MRRQVLGGHRKGRMSLLLDMKNTGILSNVPSGILDKVRIETLE